jgi:hypothetical protein
MNKNLRDVDSETVVAASIGDDGVRHAHDSAIFEG